MRFNFLRTFGVVVALAASGALGLAACASRSANGPHAETVVPPPSAPQTTEYTCPMHPEVVRATPGTCPVCGMNLEPRVHSEEHHHGDAPSPATVPDAGATLAPMPAVTPSDSLAAERAAYERARPVFERYCAKCHTTTGANAKMATLSHLNMDSYPFGGHHASEIGTKIREVLGASGKPATMPRDNKGAVRGDDLALVLAWADAFEEAHPAQGNDHHEHEGGHDHKH